MRYKHIISFLISSLIVTDLRNFLLATFLLAFSCVFERFFMCNVKNPFKSRILWWEEQKKILLALLALLKNWFLQEKKIFSYSYEKTNIKHTDNVSSKYLTLLLQILAKTFFIPSHFVTIHYDRFAFARTFDKVVSKREIEL